MAGSGEGGDRIAIAKALIAAGADINAKNADGDTPLVTAQFAESDEMIALLQASGGGE